MLPFLVGQHFISLLILPNKNPVKFRLQKWSWQWQISHIFPFCLLNHRHFHPKLVEHELWKLPWHLQNFIFFLQQKLCFRHFVNRQDVIGLDVSTGFRLNIIKIDLQILGQKLILKCYLHLLLSFKKFKWCKQKYFSIF